MLWMFGMGLMGGVGNNIGGGMSEVDQILQERSKTHGEYAQHAKMAQAMKDVVRNSPNSNKLTDSQKEGLDMILHKVARVLNGDPNHKDHWDDIAGYATLVSRSMTGPC